MVILAAKADFRRGRVKVILRVHPGDDDFDKILQRGGQ